MSNVATQRAEMPAGANKILDRRTLENDNGNLLKYLKGDIDVLDVGCGSGSITAGIAKHLHPKGSVTGIDVSGHLIAAAQQQYEGIDNLGFEVADINGFSGGRRFDVITSARVLQWLPNAEETVQKMVALLKPGGWLSILDYNHTKIGWQPQPPQSMLVFYKAFLQWRSDAGFDNEVADNLEEYFVKAGLKNICVEARHEFTNRDDEEFESKMGIWLAVAETRGHQLVKDGYISEAERMATAEEYGEWVKEGAQTMKMYLLATGGQNE
jgi:ubiquinone/menaquinone biosynthesis C-methylase UbiE